jgi:hypothetical protein
MVHKFLFLLLYGSNVKQLLNVFQGGKVYVVGMWRPTVVFENQLIQVISRQAAGMLSVKFHTQVSVKFISHTCKWQAAGLQLQRRV